MSRANSQTPLEIKESLSLHHHHQLLELINVLCSTRENTKTLTRRRGMQPTSIYKQTPHLHIIRIFIFCSPYHNLLSSRANKTSVKNGHHDSSPATNAISAAEQPTCLFSSICRYPFSSPPPPPPTLSLPTRRSTPATSFPLISLSDPNLQDLLFSASSQRGYFQLTNHNIPSKLATSAELESVSLFDLPKDKKESYFPKNWPLGFEGDEDGNGESFWLDAECSTVSTELVLASLRELTRALEKVGLEVIQMLSNGAGFENPLKEHPTRNCSLLCLHGCLDGNDGKPGLLGGSYPYIVGLQYQIRCMKYSLLSDSGWVTVMPQVDSIMVTVGDIAQVWSNGKLKKVRGRPMACLGDSENSSCISMSLLVTLPSESTVSPLLPKVIIDGINANEDEIREDEEHDNIHSLCKTGRRFGSFPFDDYAWRVYHGPLLFKDPLDKYRI